jgi:hypothetical protein
VVQQLVDSENITSCVLGQLTRRASEDHASKLGVWSDPENKEVCLYLVNRIQNAIHRFTFRERRMQMNGPVSASARHREAIGSDPVECLLVL